MNNLQEQGRALYKQGQYQKAIGFFDRAIGKAPSVSLLDNRAACYEKLGELSTALKDAKKAINLHREDATGYLRAGKILVKMDKESVALEIYTHGLKCIKHVGQGYEALRKSHKDLMGKLSPPKSVDPLTILPRELAEIVLEYLSFRQRMNACMVSKQWAHFIRSVPNLWAHLNLAGARKKVSNKFVSRAINIAKSRLTAATLNNLYDFDKVLAAVVRSTSIEELTLSRCGLQGQNLADELSKAKHLKCLTLGNGTELPPFQLRHLLQAVSEQIQSFQCTLSPGGMATIDGPICKQLKILSLEFRTSHGLTSLLANISDHLPALTSLTLIQIETRSEDRTGMHMDLEKCVHLEHVDLSLKFTSSSLLTLPQSLRVMKLNPRMVSNPDNFFSAIAIGILPAYSLPNMEELTVDFPRLPIDHLKYLLSSPGHDDTTPDAPANRPRFRKLAINGALYSAGSLQTVLEHERLADLDSISLAGCLHCDDDAVEIITTNLSKLRTIDLSNTDITGIGVKQALQQKHLEKLIVNNCRRISVDAIDWARSKGIQVEYRMLDNVSGGKKVRY